MRRPSSPLFAVMLGGLIAGAIDITYAITFSHFRGVSATRLLQSVASGLLGASSFDGGTPTALLGLCLHFFIALSAAAIFVVASRRILALTEHVVIAGIVYGVA